MSYGSRFPCQLFLNSGQQVSALQLLFFRSKPLQTSPYQGRLKGFPPDKGGLRGVGLDVTGYYRAYRLLHFCSRLIISNSMNDTTSMTVATAVAP